VTECVVRAIDSGQLRFSEGGDRNATYETRFAFAPTRKPS
jgi:hypothetical protein